MSCVQEGCEGRVIFGKGGGCFEEREEEGIGKMRGPCFQDEFCYGNGAFVEESIPFVLNGLDGGREGLEALLP